MYSHHEFSPAHGAAGHTPHGRDALLAPATGSVVNDQHARLNATTVRHVLPVDNLGVLQDALQAAQAQGLAVSIAGGRHAMGGQQFGAGTVLLDTRPLNRVLALDRERGLVEVEAGIQWPELIHTLIAMQAGEPRPWGIIQKQTGADRFCLGGALSANIHGRGLALKPIIDDVEAFTLMRADGSLWRCSRTQNAELFRLVIGGYGLFGIITSVQLRLMPRTRLERVVTLIDIDELLPALSQHQAAGYLFGDCQFAIDPTSDDFLRRGVFACYRPLPPGARSNVVRLELAERDWRELCYLAHVDPGQAFARYAAFYLATNGQTYWSDTHQLSVYLDNYHCELDHRLGSPPGTEMITELYVPPAALPALMRRVAADLRGLGVPLIYGTIRLIEQDDESFLAWARAPYACVVLNLHVEHSTEGIAQATQAFRQLIDAALALGGSYYLTYHRWARRDQLVQAYPQFPEFLRHKQHYDPEARFQSEWYRHCCQLLAEV